jgi:hypothetical protein
MRRVAALAFIAAFAGFGLGAGRVLVRSFESRTPDTASVITKMREVARLETLDVTLYKKIAFAPEPEVSGDFWRDVLAWARFSLGAPRGKAIVFADAHLGLDLGKLGPDRLLVRGRSVWVSLPPVRATIELKPGETEIIESTLDAAQTAKLFELAREAFQRQIEADDVLRARARAGAERAVRSLLLELGFTDVSFVESVPAGGPPPT